MFAPTTPLPRRGFWTVAHFGQTAVRLHWSLGAALLGIGLLTRLWLLRQYSEDLHWSTSYGVTILTLVLVVVSFVGREVVQGRVAAHHGLTISSLSFSAIGGQTRSSGPPPTPRAEFQISASGLFFTCVTTAVMFLTSRFTASIEAHSSIVDLFRWMGWVNLILAALNLAPSAPLDGGRIVTAILWHRHASRTLARLSTGRIAIVTSGLLVVAGLVSPFVRQPYGLVLLPIASILFVMARSQIRRAVIARRFETTTAADLVAKHPPTVPDSLTVHQIAAWLPPSTSQVAVPVTRWNDETVGYLSPITVKHLSEAERSWTTAKKLMEPKNTVSRCWASETIGKVIGREAAPADLLVVVHDSASKREIGTLTFEQISQLLRPPDFWGRSPIFPR